MGTTICGLMDTLGEIDFRRSGGDGCCSDGIDFMAAPRSVLRDFLCWIVLATGMTGTLSVDGDSGEIRSGTDDDR